MRETLAADFQDHAKLCQAAARAGRSDRTRRLLPPVLRARHDGNAALSNRRDFEKPLGADSAQSEAAR